MSFPCIHLPPNKTSQSKRQDSIFSSVASRYDKNWRTENGSSRHGKLQDNLGSKGNLIIGGTVTLGRGTHICIDKNGTLALGNNFCVTGNSSIICQKEISIDKDCLISWDVLIMDTDFHPIKNNQGNNICHCSRKLYSWIKSMND